MPSARRFSAHAVLSPTEKVIGVRDSSARTLFLLSLVTLFIFAGLLQAQTASPAGSWTLTGAMSQARSGAAAVALGDGRVLVTGGVDAGGAVSATAEIYSPGGSFLPAAPMNVARTGHTATWVPNENGSGGYVLVTGGTSERLQQHLHGHDWLERCLLAERRIQRFKP